MQVWTPWPAVHLRFLLQWKQTPKILQSLLQVRHTFSTKAVRNCFGWKAPTAWARIWPDLLIHCSIKKIFTATRSLAEYRGWSEKLCYWNLQKQSWVVPLRTCPGFFGWEQVHYQEHQRVSQRGFWNCTFSADKLDMGCFQGIKRRAKNLPR